MNRVSLISITLSIFILQIPSSLNAHASRDLSSFKTTNLGAPHVTSYKADDGLFQILAKFAISQYNQKKDVMLEYSRVLKVEEERVSGKLYVITLEVKDGGRKKVYKAKVSVKPWTDFKQLEEFKRVDDGSSCSSADSGTEEGWVVVPTHDSGARSAAENAVKIIQQRSNSLLPYELLDIVSAKSKVFLDNNRYDLLLKVKRGDREEKFRVEINKNADGKYILCSMDQVPSKI